MKDYFFTLFNTIIHDLNLLYNYIPNFILNYLYNLKFKFIEIILDFDLSLNYYFFFIYITFIYIVVNFLYKLVYATIFYLNFYLIFDIYISLKQLKSFIILNKFEKKFLYYYKSLFEINLKQFLIGTGIIIFYLFIYEFFIIIFEFLNYSQQISLSSKIYYGTNFTYFNCLDFFFQFSYINIIYSLILIYLFLHILFGLFNIFYDYLKDISFILFFLSFFIFLNLFNIYLLHNNLELYINLINYILK